MAIDQSSFVLNEGTAALNRGVQNGKISESAKSNALDAISTGTANLRLVGVENPPLLPVVITYTDPATHKKHEFAGIKHVGDQTPVELADGGALIRFETTGPNKGKPTQESAGYLAGLANGHAPARAAGADKVDEANMLPTADYAKEQMDKAFEKSTTPMERAKAQVDAQTHHAAGSTVPHKAAPHTNVIQR